MRGYHAAVSGLQVRLLGVFEVVVDGRAVVVRGATQRSCLALLALRAGRSVPPETLIDLLWAERAPKNVRAALHSVIAKSRQLLGPESIGRDEAGYRLDIVPADVDVLRFLALLDDAERSDDRQQLAAALALWGEPLAGGIVASIRHEHGPELYERYLRGVERRIDLDLEAGQRTGICEELGRLTHTFPLRESLWLRLLKALVAEGRRPEALDQYERMRVQLADGLGIDPSAELQAFHLSLLDDDPVPDRTAQPAVPRQLPLDLRRFIGRTAQLEELNRLLPSGSDTARVVVLHGAAGAGKTSLAVHWAHQAKDRFPDGQIFLGLRGYGAREPLDAETALDTILRGLGLPGARIPADLESRSALLRTELAARRLLLILDDARSADQIRPLLPGSSTQVLVTSRSRLSSLTVRDGAEPIAVPALDGPEGRELLRRLIQNPALDERALDELVRLCSGLPLALAITGEQLNRHPDEAESVTGRLRSLAERIDVLSSGDSPATDVRAVLSWSYQALDPEAAAMLRALGAIAVEPLRLPAIAALAGLPLADARRTLRVLTDLHLVHQVDAGQVRLHDVMRAYARERSAAEDGAAVRHDAANRLVHWYLSTAEVARTRESELRLLPLLPAPPGAPESLPLASTEDARAWFEAERRTLITLVLDTAERGEHELAARLAVTLWDDLERSYALTDSRLVQATAVTSAARAGDPLLRAVALNQHGATLGMSGDLEAAADALREALTLFAAAGHEYGERMVRSNLSIALRLLGRPQEAIEQLELALAGSMATEQEGTLRNNLAMTYLATAQYDEAVASATEAIRLHRLAGDTRGTAYAQDTLGQGLKAVGDLPAALAAFQDAARLNEKLDNHGGLSGSLVRLGETELAAGLVTEARKTLMRALRLLSASERSGWQREQEERIRALLTQTARVWPTG
ncbi:BTAD domain-containing putative transcriptional regulator [Kribbella sandramycini]